MLTVLTSCFGEDPVAGKWKLEIKLQDRVLPVLIHLNKPSKTNQLTGSLINGEEVLELEGTIKKNKKFTLSIAAHYAKLVGKISGNKIEGQWIRTNKDDFSIDFTGGRTVSENLFSEFEQEKTQIDLEGKWKITLDKEKTGLGLFKQKGSRVQGSILTTTGDYRFLDGHVTQNKLFLYGFDGVFSFVLEGVIDKEQFAATMISGLTTSKKITGIKDEAFELSSPLTLTEKTSEKPLSLKVVDIDGDSISLDSGEYKDKVKIIQVFGSWCPNCHDETNFFVEWREKNPDLKENVKFLALSFERSNSREQALKDLKKVRAKLKIDYDVVLAGVDSDTKVDEFLPIKETIAFPTTLFVDKNNMIQKIHTGFAGQATGLYFENFQRDFDKTIRELVK